MPTRDRGAYACPRNSELTLASLMPRPSEILLHGAPGPCSGTVVEVPAGQRQYRGKLRVLGFNHESCFSGPFTSVLVVANTGV